MEEQVNHGSGQGDAEDPLEDLGTVRFNPSLLDDLPPLTIPEAAWLAGVTEEAFERFLLASNTSRTRGLDGAIYVTLGSLVKAGFTLLGQKEAQVTMLRMQLTTALKREQELVGALKEKIAFHHTPVMGAPAVPRRTVASVRHPDDGREKTPASARTVPATDEDMQSEKAEKGGKGGKKRKRRKK